MATNRVEKYGLGGLDGIGLLSAEDVPVDPDQERRDHAEEVIAARKSDGVRGASDSDVIDALLELRG